MNRKKIRLILSDYDARLFSEKKPSHRDLNPFNVFYTKEGYKVIDYENAGQDDPFFDIVTILIFNFQETSSKKKFLFHYFKRDLTKAETNHLQKMQRLVFLYYGLSLLKKLPPEIINKETPSLKFSQVLDFLLAEKLSLENPKHILTVAKSMLVEAGV